MRLAVPTGLNQDSKINRLGSKTGHKAAIGKQRLSGALENSAKRTPTIFPTEAARVAASWREPFARINTAHRVSAARRPEPEPRPATLPLVEEARRRDAEARARLRGRNPDEPGALGELIAKAALDLNTKRLWPGRR